MDSFFYQIYLALQAELSKEDWVTLVTFSEESVEKERELLAALVAHKVSGIVMSVCHSSKNNELYQSIIDRGIPIVFFDRVPTRIRASSVNIDNEGAVFELTEHLIQSGYKNIVHVAGPPHLSISRPRRKGYEEAMKKYKMPVQTYSCGNLDIDSGAAVAVDLIEDLDKIDAVVTCDDMIAIGLVHELQRRGFRIPSDVAVSGIGGSVMNTVVFPEITTIEFPMPEMGSCAAGLVMSMIREVEKEKERERKEKERKEKSWTKTGKKIGVAARKKTKTKTVILKPTTCYRASTEKNS